MRILLVEDDPMIGEALRASLKEALYTVDWVHDGRLAEEALFTQNYDLVLLDLGLPRQDGLSVLRQARSEKNMTPVLIITARDDIESRLAGLDGGADDYLVKPFDFAELHARMRAIIRRHLGQESLKPSNGVITLDPQTFQAEVAGEQIPLTNKEFLLLQALVNHAGVILSRADLEDKIYGWGKEIESNAIDFLIHSLRKKIGREHIKNVRGVGWLVAKS